MPRIRPLLLALAATLPVCSQAFVNVSHLVNGGAKESLPMVLVTPEVDCAGACQYQAMSRVGMSDGYTQTPTPYRVPAWPAVWAASLAGLSDVEDSLPIAAPPGGTQYQTTSFGTWQRARVQFDSPPILGGTHEMAVQAFRSGSGVATVTYTIRITPGATPRRTFIDLGVPQRGPATSAASPFYTMNDNNFYDTVDRLQARSAVDVYVDGLPVWSTSSQRLKPRDWSNGTFGRVTLAWGEDPTTERVVLFLGTLGGSPRTVSVVVRSDLRVNDDECRNGQQYASDITRCHDNREGMALPTRKVSNGLFMLNRPDLRVYTR